MIPTVVPTMIDPARLGDGVPPSPRPSDDRPSSYVSALRRIRNQPPAARAGERCEMCAQPIADEHRHVVDLRDRSLLCTCRACGLLFTNDGAAGGRYRSVPERYATVGDFALTSAQWESLQIPVAIAFFFHNSDMGATAAFFPSPAGATECLLPLDVWGEVEAANPVATSLEPDVEALLVRISSVSDRDGTADGIECFIVPIDACYELVGHLRTRWRGFDGGREVHDQMTAFFDDVRRRARPISRAHVRG